MNGLNERRVLPVIDKIDNYDNNKVLTNFLLQREYFREFIIVNGFNQHKDGLNYEQWINRILEADI